MGPSHSVVVPMISLGKMAMPVLEGRMSMQVGVSGTSRRDYVGGARHVRTRVRAPVAREYGRENDAR